MEKKVINGRTWIIIGVVVVLLAVLGVGGYAISRGNAAREESLLELGQRYLDELNYEQAVVCFEEYLEIDPQCVEAYAGLAQAYVGLGEYEKALEVLAEGYAVTGDGSLQELGSRIEEQYREILLAEGNSDSGEGNGSEEPDELTETTPEPEEEFVGPLVLDTATVGICAGNGGVIVTLENELYGAINYQGKEIVPHIYSDWWTAPTDDGYFALGDVETVHVFNAEGQEVLAIDVPETVYLFNAEGQVMLATYGLRQMYISDDGVLYRTGEGIKWHDLLQGTTTDLVKSEEHYVDSMTQMQDGKTYYLSHDDGFNPVVFVATREGTEEILFTRQGGFEFWWMSPSVDGYFILGGGSPSDDTTSEYAIFRETDGKEYYIVCGDSNIVKRDVYPFLGDAFLPISYASIVGGYYRDGAYYYSRGTQIVIEGSNKPSHDAERTCYLLDLTNAKLKTFGTKGEYVTNPSALILAQYDYIELSDSGYYLAGDGESWFYLDERGQRVAQTFLDCGSFYNGYSIILDTDGMAYLIDTEFNRVSEGYPADGVYTAEAIFCVISGDQVTILTAPEE